MAKESIQEANDSITQSVSQRYAKAVREGEEMCCPTGYDHENLRQFIPEPVLKVSYGCGTPVGLSTVQPGEVVLDIGSGGGIDCFEASRKVGPKGRVIGIDMTDEMLTLARTHAPTVAHNLGYPEPNVDFRKGFAGAIPVGDNQVDLIISNCVINLAPDKEKVFQEMFRVTRPQGRFTISDIVSDQPIPNYLIHDKAKWGDCLSGALTIADYWGGLRKAGFRGLHQVMFLPWRIIDGIHFFSITLTGYKLPPPLSLTRPTFATLVGPFSQAVDEQGNRYERGRPQQIDDQTSTLLNLSPYKQHFLHTDEPETLSCGDAQWTAIHPEQTACVWEGQFAILTGPFLSVRDDDAHDFEGGIPLEICSKTLKVLQHPFYLPHFGILDRAQGGTGTEPVICGTDTGCC